LLLAAIKRNPADGQLWLELALLEAAKDGGTQQLLGALEASYKLAPREGWIARDRLLLALQLWPELPQELKDLAVYDVLGPWDASLENLSSALDLLHAAAESGNHYALERLGQVYLNGEGIVADPETGRAYLEQAIEAGNVGAQIKLGEALIKGQKLPKNATVGVKLLEDAATRNSLAKLVLANLLLSGELPRDTKRGLDLLHAAAESGNHYALERLGQVYLNGEGIVADPETGRAYLEQAIKARASKQR
jgi:TPR repeat protein